MAEIVAGIAASHAPFVAMHPQFEQAPAAQGERVIKAFTAARELLERAAADVIVIFSNDHLDRFFFDNLPAFCVGIGEEAEGRSMSGSGCPRSRCGCIANWVVSSSQRDSRLGSILLARRNSPWITPNTFLCISSLLVGIFLSFP
jgi:hypothetical protein